MGTKAAVQALVLLPGDNGHHCPGESFPARKEQALLLFSLSEAALSVYVAVQLCVASIYHLEGNPLLLLGPQHMLVPAAHAITPLHCCKLTNTCITDASVWTNASRQTAHSTCGSCHGTNSSARGTVAAC